MPSISQRRLRQAINFYAGIVRGLPFWGWAALQTAQGLIASAVFASILLSGPIGRRFFDWDGLDPRWALAAVGIFTVLGFFRAIYEEVERLTQARDLALTELAATRCDLETESSLRHAASTADGRLAYELDRPLGIEALDDNPYRVWRLRVSNRGFGDLTRVRAYITEVGGSRESISSADDFTRHVPLPLHLRPSEPPQAQVNLVPGEQVLFDLVAVDVPHPAGRERFHFFVDERPFATPAEIALTLRIGIAADDHPLFEHVESLRVPE